MSDDVFITYTHPSQQTDKSNRRKAAQYVGLHFRNRSRPIHKRAQREAAQAARVLPHGYNSLPSQADLLRTTQQGLILSISRDHSGLREDPFSSYPIRHTYAIAPAVDYFIYSYATSHLIRPEFVSAEQGDLLIRQYFQYALQHSLMFEAIIGLARVNSTINTWSSGHVDDLALYHHGQAISKLRQAILEARTDDAVLFAIMAMIGTNYLLNDLDAFSINMMGLRRLVALRGGLDQLGWPDLLKPGIVGLESIWAYLKNQPHLIQSTTKIEPPSTEPLVQVDLGYKEALQLDDTLIAELPEGFRPLAESHRLRNDLLKLVAKVAVSDLSLQHALPTTVVQRDGVHKYLNFKTPDGRDFTVASNLQVLEQLAALLAQPNLNMLERACCIGMLIASLGCTRTEQFSPIYSSQLQHHAGELLDMPLDEDDTAARDLIAWAIFNVASTMVPPNLAALPKDYMDDLRFALTIKIVDYFFPINSWSGVEKILCRFIWAGSCLPAWRSVWNLGNHKGYREGLKSSAQSPAPLKA